ncbi:TonB-dependent receptor [Sphingomonas sp. AP4-R1]|uniref:TonB-dependent receptor domain-containing protein n=1 Tax=Sphingomonas sp. AP4-R1 TaxID=2735134 RepID=UPI001493BBD8|nr:TonB-dependent receptor [Sphingomonas sp. AP4-R1]QJU58301.1 TonB-dependent receptor [Sphingomonas sp. AP4-R1]
MHKAYYLSSISLFAAVISSASYARTADSPALSVSSSQNADSPQTSASSDSSSEISQAADIVVTGSLSATTIERAPISITAVDNTKIRQQSPLSAAELLKNVPGVFVNSAFGEARAVVYSRGVSANSLDASGGYFYVSLQEDGLPVEGMLASNFGPDYFTRTDLYLDRLEALRGGTAAIVGPNAPGGVFNYKSRDGDHRPGTEISAKVGLEGDGRNPYYRADAYTGGRIGGTNLSYAVGGFYRHSDGARDAGYAFNYGGQIRGNLKWDYGNGTLTLSGKFLDDHISFPEFLPAFNYADPKIAAPFNNYSSVLPARSKHAYANGTGGQESYDAADLVHTRAQSIGLSWTHDINDDWHIANNARFSHNTSDWATGANTFAVPLTDPTGNRYLGVNGLSGVLTYRDRDSGATLARVSTNGSSYSVLSNNLPNQQILANGVINESAFAQKYRATEFQDQFTLSGSIGNHKVTVGTYIFLGRLNRQVLDGGVGFAQLTNKPQMLDVTLTTPGGTVYQVTDPSGFGNHLGLNFGQGFRGTQNNFAGFAGDTWQVTDKLSIDVGVRGELLDYDVTNTVARPYTGNRLTDGGVDGNPLTLYDNATYSYFPVRAKRNFGYVNFSAAATYQWTNEFQTYVRYTDGKKAPDFRLISNINTIAAVNTVFPVSQRIQQAEIGIKYQRRGLSLQAYPFYSKLTKVFDVTLLTDENNIQYTPPPVYGQIETYGVEFQGNVDLTRQLNLYAAVTLQNPKASGFGAYSAGPTASRFDDVLTMTPKGDADNNPKIIVRSTATYTPKEGLSLFATYSYLGKRAANRNNAFYLPGFSTVDAGISYDVTSRFNIQFNVNNVFNNYGILSWAKGGGFTEALNRQNLTKADVAANPNQLIAVIPSPPRAFFLTGSYKF